MIEIAFIGVNYFVNKSHVSGRRSDSFNFYNKLFFMVWFNLLKRCEEVLGVLRKNGRFDSFFWEVNVVNRDRSV